MGRRMACQSRHQGPQRMVSKDAGRAGAGRGVGRQALGTSGISLLRLNAHSQPGRAGQATTAPSYTCGDRCGGIPGVTAVSHL